MIRLLPALLVLVSACAPAEHVLAPPAAEHTVSERPDPVASATALVEAVRARHGATWYRTLAFVQETTFHTAEGPRVQTWFEAAAVPGRLRIDVAPLGAGGTYLFLSDSTHLAPAGRPVVRRGGGNPLLLFSFDIVAVPAAETLAGMVAAGIDTAAVRSDVWEGRPAVVVGGRDAAAPQVWFDHERLVFVRLVERQGEATHDTRFRDYRPLGGGWIAPTVEFYTDGVLTQTERYREIRTGLTFPEGSFSPRAFPGVAWWTAAGYDGTE